MAISKQYIQFRNHYAEKSGFWHSPDLIGLLVRIRDWEIMRLFLMPYSQRYGLWNGCWGRKGIICIGPTSELPVVKDSKKPISLRCQTLAGAPSHATVSFFVFHSKADANQMRLSDTCATVTPNACQMVWLSDKTVTSVSKQKDNWLKISANSSDRVYLNGAVKAQLNRSFSPNDVVYLLAIADTDADFQDRSFDLKTIFPKESYSKTELEALLPKFPNVAIKLIDTSNSTAPEADLLPEMEALIREQIDHAESQEVS